MVYAVWAKFAVLLYFIPFLHFDSSEITTFICFSGVTITYYYSVPILFNMIAVCLAVIHEEYLRHFFEKKYLVCKIIYLILIYFSIFSNLYCSIIFAAFAAAKILQYLFVEARDYTTDLVDKLIQSFVYVFGLILWIISMIFEVAGGRAEQLSGVKFDLKGSAKAYAQSFTTKNPLFVILVIAALLMLVISFVHIMRNKERYLSPIINKIKKRAQKEEQKDKETDDKDRLLFRYVNQGILMLICALLASVFMILLAAKTGSSYFYRSGVHLDYYFFLINILFMTMALLLKYQRKSLYGVIVCILIMAVMIVYKRDAYVDHDRTPEECQQLADYIIRQYVEADINNVEYTYIHVPDYHTGGDNFPIATYGNQRIPMTLYNYGIIKKWVNSELVPDEEVNKLLGME